MSDFRATLTDLRERRQKLDIAIAALEELAQNRPGRRKWRHDPEAHAANPLSMRAALEALMGTAREPLAIRDIVSHLRRVGFERVTYNSVYNTLHRLSEPKGPFRHHDNKWHLQPEVDTHRATSPR